MSPRAIPLRGDPGNLGLLPSGADTALFLAFDEPDGVLPSDATGTLGDLSAISADSLTVPTVVSSWTGRGRAFDPARRTALVGGDAPGRSTLLARDITVQAIVSVPADATGPVMPIVTRGLGESDVDHCSYSLVLGVTGVAHRWELFWSWQTVGGVHRESAGALVDIPPGQPVLLTATRRWEGTSRVVCRFFAHDELLGEVVSPHGDIAGATSGRTMVGARKVGDQWRFARLVLDQLLVARYEMAPDEVRATWHRLSAWQPAGVEAMRALIPPGAPWARDPASRIGRRLGLAGQALGLVMANAAELRDTWLPHAADRTTLTRWERVCGLAPRPLDSLDVRRARTVAFLARDNGLSTPALQVALAEPLRVAPRDVQIIELSNTVTDSFATLSAERWHAETSSSWWVTDNQLRLTRGAGNDLRWDPANRNPTHLRMPIESGDGELAVSAKLVDATLPDGVTVGLMLFNRRSGNTLWFGVRVDGGGLRVGYLQARDGALSSFGTVLSGVAAPLWLRIVRRGHQSYELSTTLVASGVTAQARLDTGMPDPEYVGFGAVATTAPNPTAITAAFSDFSARTPLARRPFRWFALRDPRLPGTPDMTGASLVLRKLRPAHTDAAVIVSRSVLCDTDGHGCDAGPMGAL